MVRGEVCFVRTWSVDRPGSVARVAARWLARRVDAKPRASAAGEVGGEASPAPEEVEGEEVVREGSSWVELSSRNAACSSSSGPGMKSFLSCGQGGAVCVLEGERGFSNMGVPCGVARSGGRERWARAVAQSGGPERWPIVVPNMDWPEQYCGR